MVSVLCLALACHPHQLPTVADYIRGTGRRWWATEYRCDDRRNWCKRGLEGVLHRGK
jgi:hypothetical protein